MSTTIVSFSGRKTGNCERIGRYVQALTGGQLFSFAQLEIHPCGGCNYECFGQSAVCPYQDDGLYLLYDAITTSDAAYFILPNYCDCPCANYFIFNERSQCYFQRHAERAQRYERVKKKAVVVSNTEEETFRWLLAQQADAPVDILFLHAKDYGRISLRGDLMEDEAVRVQLKAFIMAVHKYARRGKTNGFSAS